MISFRYHIITIVAIFLAVGLGLLVGNTVVQPSLVKDLERRTDELRADLTDVRGEVTALHSEVDGLKRSGDIMSQLDDSGLVDVPVVVVTYDGVDGAALSEARRVLDDAGADTVAVLSVTDRMAATDDPTRQDLAEIVGVPSEASAETVQTAAAAALAERLADGASKIEPSSTSDVLDALLTGNFVVAPPGAPTIAESDLTRIGGRGQVVVVISGGEDEPSVDPETFMVPLVQGLLRRGITVAAGESASTQYPFVGPIRADGALADGTRLVTVDDVDYPIGAAALALGLERLLTLGEGGHYGIREDATSPIPPIR